jgi:tetratricopeptide (TPR) repeat protein
MSKTINLKTFSCFFLFSASLFMTTLLTAQDYAQGWEYFNKNNREQATTAFKKALNNPKTANDAALALMYLATFEGHETSGRALWQKVSKNVDNPYPYIYTLWSNGGMSGGYGQKNDEQERFLNDLLKDANAPGMLKATANYELSLHYFSKDKFKLATETAAKSTNVAEWQFVGPFDNISGSGFDKNYPPIAQPQADATFKSANNADIKWFTPVASEISGWITTSHHVKWNTAIVYAQSFVTSPTERDVFLGFGMAGNFKVWVNDRLVLSELEERKTEFDVYQSKVHLKKGVNRVLVQLGYEDESNTYFSLRLVDEQGNLVPDVTSSSQYAAYTKDNTEGVTTSLPFYAETYFEKKVKNEPDNLINYIILTETYLRAAKGQEALIVVEKALEKAPDNAFLHYQHLAAYSKTNNRTGVAEELAKIKELDEECPISLNVKFNEEFKNEKYDDAQKILDRMIELYGEDEQTAEFQLKLYSAEKKMEDLVKCAEKAYNKYPTNVYFNRIKYNLVLNMKKDPNAAIGVYEGLLKKNYNNSTAMNLVDAYLEQGMNAKGLGVIKKIEQFYPSDPYYANMQYNYFYAKKENESAKKFSDRVLGLTPFASSNWENAAKLAEQMGKKDEALKYFQKSLHYNQNNYDARRRIRELEKKTNLDETFPKVDYYALLKKTKADAKTAEFNWYYVLDESNTIVYPERNSETWRTLVVKVLNEKGIDAWKETSLGYNENRQRLIIEKAEVVKPNGTKIAAEQNGNSMVFTNLQKGDGLVIRYRIVSYSYGRMAREFWDYNIFNAYIPVETGRYALLMSNSVPIEIKNHNFDAKPTIKDVEDYKLYTWEVKNEPAMEEEKNSPSIVDAGKSVHISTLSDWSPITTWYANVSASQAKQDYDVKKLSQTLFPAGKKFSETEKAKIIYEWILKNIRYSSVSFRQSGYVPQRASKVLQTKLGDCKDLATLYAALARENGLKAQLVLINTRDNGDNDILLPSMEFNHCIVKVIADNKPWYLELTDPNLSFASLPNSDLKALALEIPFNDDKAVSKPFPLNPDNRSKDYRGSVINVQVKNRDLQISTSCIRGGNLSSVVRSSYQNLTKVKMIEKIQTSIGGDFTNPVTVKDVNFDSLETLVDTINFNVKYNVKNEVIEVGELSTMKVPYYNLFIKADAFQEETRTQELNYWQYEDCDHYHEDITLNLPDGKQFTDVPKSVNLSYNGTQYSLKFEKKSASVIQVTRDIKANRSNIPVAEYPNFRKFMDDILAAEAKYIAFK